MTKYTNKTNTNRRKGNPRASRQGDQGNSTTGSHTITTTEVHPMNTAGKAELQETQKQIIRVTYNWGNKKELPNKKNGRLPSKRAR